LYVSGGTLTLSGGTITGNVAKGGYGATGRCVVKGSGGPGGQGGNGCGGGLYVSGAAVTLTGDSFTSNQATGGPGGSGGTATTGKGGNGGQGGSGLGGGLYVSGGTVELSGNSFASNQATGGAGGAGGSATTGTNGNGGVGGNGYGGGLFVASGMVSLSGDTVQSNLATAGAGGAGPIAGSPGAGTGGGLAIVSGASVSISTSTDISGNDPDQNVVINTATLTVTPDNWTSAGLTMTLGSDGNLHIYTTGTTTDAVPPVAPASVTTIAITAPDSGDINLTIDSSDGDPIPAGGLNYSGPGGLIVTGSNTVALSSPNTYTGGTTIAAGTLLVNSALALPVGTSLTVGAGGTFVFDPSQSAANASAAAPVTTNVVSSIPASSNYWAGPANAAPGSGPTLPLPALEHPSPEADRCVASPIPTPPTLLPESDGRHEPSPFAPFPVGEGSYADSSDQQRKKDVAILAREAVFAQHDQI
jgi:autotransporter-associated beta strand protein